MLCYLPELYNISNPVYILSSIEISIQFYLCFPMSSYQFYNNQQHLHPMQFITSILSNLHIHPFMHGLLISENTSEWPMLYLMPHRLYLQTRSRYMCYNILVKSIDNPTTTQYYVKFKFSIPYAIYLYRIESIHRVYHVKIAK